MVTLREWFGEFTEETGETPTHIVLGGPGAWVDGVLMHFDAVPGVVMDERFDDGYGGTDGPDLCAWSHSWVIFSDRYDGSESLRWVPRNPVAHEPIRPGGG